MTLRWQQLYRLSPKHVPAEVCNFDMPEGSLHRCRGGVTLLSHGLSMLAVVLLILGLYVNITKHLFNLQEQLEMWDREKSVVVENIEKRSLHSCPCANTAAHSFLNSEGLEAMQMAGSLPALQIKKNGTIGPWIVDNGSNATWANLSQDRTQLVINEPGMYFVYAQIFYLTASTPNSFEIVRRSSNGRNTLSVCANQVSSALKRPTASSEVSCFTAVVTSLHREEKLFLNQIEQNRVIIFSSGFSQWGLIKLQHKGED